MSPETPDATPDETGEAPTKVQEAAATVSDAQADETSSGKLSGGRRWGVRILLVLATVLGVIALLAVWVNRQALNAENWSNTSSALLQNDKVRDQVSLYLVDQVYANVNVSGEIESVLPKQLQPLAGPAAGAVQNLANSAVKELLGRPLVQEAWKGANKLAMQQFINIVEERQTGLVTSSNGDVVINLQPLVVSAVDKLGLPAKLKAQIPADAGQIKVISSDDVAAVQSYAKLLRGLGVLLPIIVFLLFAIAIAIARGHRRRTLMYVGVDLIIIGVLVLVVRAVGGNVVVDQLATTDAVRPAVQAVWNISTEMLRDMAWGAILTAIPLILAALLAGPTKVATSSRRALAPWLREQRGVTYGVVGFVVLVLILWAPLHWMQLPIPVLVMILLVILGVELLRRQTMREFPDAPLPDLGERMAALGASAKGAAQKGGTAVTGAVTSARDSARDRHAERSAAAAARAAEAPTAVAPAAAVAPPAPAPPAPAAPSGGDTLARLERLAALQQSGLLTDDEVAEQKRQILASGD